MFKALASAVLLRRISRDLGDIAASLRLQTAMLARFAERYAPADPPTERAEVRADTGVTHLDPDEAFLAQEFIARTERETGHRPDDDEVLIHLADEKTVDLHQRLQAREGELERLRETRSW